MPVINTDWKFRHPATRATDFSTSNVGGAKTATDINQISVGGVFFDMPSNSSGGGSKTQYAKVFLVNTNGSSSATNCKLYMSNILDDVSGNQIVKAVSSSISDNSTYYIRIVGKSDTGAALTHNLTLNGTTEVSTTGILWSAVHRVELRLVSSNAIVVANGDITITHGSTVIGKIPAGITTASGEVSFGMETGLDGSQTVALPSTAPSGVTFYKLRTEASALSFQGGGTVAAGVGQGVWLKWIVTETTSASEDVELAFDLYYESV